MPLSPVLERQTTYPFVRLERGESGVVEARGVERDRLRQGRPERADRSADPAGARRRAAATGWAIRARGRPAGAARGGRGLGSAALRRRARSGHRDRSRRSARKEAIFSLRAGRSSTRRRTRRRSSSPSPAIRSTSAALCSRAASRCALPLREENGFLPDLDAIDDETWSRIAVFWVNYPNNPTGAVAPLAFYERARGAARASTTSCSPPTRRTPSSGSTSRRASALQVARPHERRRLQHAFEALLDDRLPLAASSPATPALVAALKAFRPTVGTAPQEFVQRASVVAWSDEEHVERTRARYRAQARRAASSAARGARAARRRRARRRCTSGSRCRTARRRRRSPSVCSSTASSSSPGSYFGAGRRGLRPDRARPDPRGVRASPRRSWRTVL